MAMINQNKHGHRKRQRSNKMTVVKENGRSHQVCPRPAKNDHVHKMPVSQNEWLRSPNMAAVTKKYDRGHEDGRGHRKNGRSHQSSAKV